MSKNQSVDTPEEEQKLSPEQLKERQEKLLKHYEDSLPLLEKQLEYESLVTKVTEQRFNQFRMEFQMNQMMAPPPEEKVEISGQPIERKLVKPTHR